MHDESMREQRETQRPISLLTYSLFVCVCLCLYGGALCWSARLCSVLLNHSIIVWHYKAYMYRAVSSIADTFNYVRYTFNIGHVKCVYLERFHYHCHTTTIRLCRRCDA